MSKGRLLFYLGLLVCGTFWFAAIDAWMLYLDSYRESPWSPIPFKWIVRNQTVGAVVVTALWLGITWWRIARRSGRAK